MKDFKSVVTKRNNPNFKFVRIRSMRTCCHCLKTMTIGTECLTINPKRGSRRWMCDTCVQAILDLQRARSVLASTAFGDEGGYMANAEWVSECESYFEELRG